MRILLLIFIAINTIALGGCAQKASWHANEVANSENQKLTVGEVQRKVKKGMSGGQVAEALGSPNVVSTNENGNEVWIYDKFYTENVVSASNGLTFTLSRVAGGASRTSQASITIIINFNADSKVSKIAYHKSSF